jgi:hypothetical protein
LVPHLPRRWRELPVGLSGGQPFGQAPNAIHGFHVLGKSFSFFAQSQLHVFPLRNRMPKRKRSASDVSDASDGSDLSYEEDLIASGLAAPGARDAAPAHINNVDGLRQALNEVRRDLPWIERLEVVSAEPLVIEDVNDDLKLELGL